MRKRLVSDKRWRAITKRKLHSESTSSTAVKYTGVEYNDDTDCGVSLAPSWRAATSRAEVDEVDETSQTTTRMIARRSLSPAKRFTPTHAKTRGYELKLKKNMDPLL
ncbi:hypothetical protein PHLCEN_2v4731 [Hermanssonia centrifuga]|uniref:Uncharacterized protein n=1 Tax=Hermanssonia centrifuga TaxID=98765 RepID=A0A2R6PJY4_9APHY|nr:hypothetical protein PHLCEN_2v4731 [Hermanssonia centrifuga]